MGHPPDRYDHGSSYRYRHAQSGIWVAVLGDLTIALLGPPEVRVDGHPLQVDTRKAVALLAYLAVTGVPQSRDVLATLLWPEYPPERARGALRRTLSTLRTGMGQRWVTADRVMVRFEPDRAVMLDVAGVEELLQPLSGHGHPLSAACPECIPPLTKATDLHRDDFLAGFALRDSPDFEDWQLAQSSFHRRQLGLILERLSMAHAAAGAYGPAIESADRRVALDPLNEAAQSRLMLLHAWSGDRAGAIRRYRDCVRVLEEELGVAPLQETTEAYEAILEDDLPPAPAPPVRVRPIGRPAPPTQGLPLVGRDAEWTGLSVAYALAGDGGQLVVVEGEAGIGKTRLVEDFAAHLAADGVTILSARGHEDEEGLAYGLFHDALLTWAARPEARDAMAVVPEEALAEAARLVPELAPDRIVSRARTESPAARSRFFDGVGRVLAAASSPAPAVLVFDDLHFADTSSVELLAYLLHRLDRLELLVVVTWRTEHVTQDHPLRRLVAELSRLRRCTILRPGRLTEPDIARMAEALLPNPPTDELVKDLAVHTEGVPFFLVEYLAALAADPASMPEVPAGVESLLASRLSGLGEQAGQVLETAAVLGRLFDFDLLTAASGRSEEEVGNALDELAARSLLREPPGGPEGGLDFTHELLRSHVYRRASLARRRLLHRRAAVALRARHRRRPEMVAAEVATHLHKAGHEQEAADWYLRAARHARSVYAHPEALNSYRAALALGHPAITDLHMGIGDVLTRLGAYGEALAAYQATVALGQGPPAPAVDHRLGEVYRRLGRWDTAERYLAAADRALGADGSSSAHSRLAADRSLVAFGAGNRARAEELAGIALNLAEEAGDDAALAQAHNLLGILADPPEAVVHLEAALRLAERMVEPELRAAALNNLALTHGREDRIEEAIDAARQALDVAGPLGDRHREAALHNNLADLLHAAGQETEAMDHLKRAVALFAEVGSEPGSMEPAIWKLTQW